jgi:ParB family transcriptional regulator, chromosome partitioning protein
MEIGKTYFKEIDVGLLKEAKYNPPERTTDEDIQWLVKSIAQNGVLQNLIVVEPEEQERFEIVCGTRRAKAAKLAGKRTVPCNVISKDTTVSERRLMNLTENIHRKDLSYQEQFIFVAEILKAFNENIQLVALKIGWPETRVLDLLKYGDFTEKVKASIKSPEDFKNAISCVDLPEDKVLKTMQIAREKGFSNRTVANLAETMKNDLELEPEEAAEKVKSRGTKISITLDGEWNEALTNAVLKIDTTKYAYAEEALKRRLVADGFHPQQLAVMKKHDNRSGS